MSDIEEKVMVVNRGALSKLGLFNGLSKSKLPQYLKQIRRECEFIPRFIAEESPFWKQIVVYCVVRHSNRFLVFQRRGYGEAAIGLEDRYSIGVGGHVSLEDMKLSGKQTSDVFITAARREMAEELDQQALNGHIDFNIIGLLNDDTNPTGQLHFGIVFEVVVKDEVSLRPQGELRDNSGAFLPISNLLPVQDQMENWSSMILNSHLLPTIGRQVSVQGL